jgi:ubiquinone/menaquinone biosynthesis C-methylase UbiE|tara:strand:- start:6677 stop:7414 length:738 start_codon:yes stop_codon:yes gene_type:complete
LQTNIYFKPIQNWDNKTWLSSKKYIKSFNKFLVKQGKLNKTSKVVDVGCGRGKICGSLFSKLNLKNKPLGLDIISHKDRDKRINFKKVDALTFFKKNNNTFDLILIKQTIHLFRINEIKKLLFLCNKRLSKRGKIFVLSLDSYRNEIPTFSSMDRRLKVSFSKDKKIINLISKLYPKKIIKKFSFNVKMPKKKYLNMIKNRYISILLKFSPKKILDGVREIDLEYKKILRFKDKLQCIIINKIPT